MTVRAIALLLVVGAAAACGGKTALLSPGDAAPDLPRADVSLPDAPRPPDALRPDLAPLPDVPPAPDAPLPVPSTWALSLDGPVAELPEAIAVDSAGNVIVAGGFAGTIDVGGQTVTAQGSYDVFVVSLSPQGKTRWVLTGGGPGHDTALDVALDGADNIYVTGEFNGTATLGGKSVSSAGSGDLFLARLGPAGAVSWLVRAGGVAVDRGRSVAVDSAGNGYVAGSIGGLAKFGAHPVSTSGFEEVALARFTSGGAFAWAKSSVSSTWSRARAVGLGAGGHVYLAGELGDSLALDGKSVKGQGTSELFVARLEPDGALAWLVGAGGPKEDRLDALVVDGSGQAYLAGMFTQLASFGAHALKTLNTFDRDLFLTRISPGGTFDWAIHSGGYSTLFGAVLAAGPGGGVILAGYCSFPTKLGPTAICPNVPWKQDSIYLAEVSPAGAVLWSSAPTAGLRPTDMALDADGAPHLLGLFAGSVTLAGATLTASGADDVFVWKVPAP